MLRWLSSEVFLRKYSRVNVSARGVAVWSQAHGGAAWTGHIIPGIYPQSQFSVAPQQASHRETKLPGIRVGERSWIPSGQAVAVN